MKPETIHSGASAANHPDDYARLLAPYGSSSEALALVRMGRTLHVSGERLTNFAWSAGQLAKLGSAFNDALQSQGCPAYVNSGSLGAILLGIEATSEAMQRIIDEALEIGDLASISRERPEALHLELTDQELSRLRAVAEQEGADLPRTAARLLGAALRHHADVVAGGAA